MMKKKTQTAILKRMVLDEKDEIPIQITVIKKNEKGQMEVYDSVVLNDKISKKITNAHPFYPTESEVMKNVRSFTKGYHVITETVICQ